MRTAITVQAAVGDDLGAVADLCTRARTESASGAQLCSDDRATLMRQLSVLLALPGGAVLIARQDDVTVGFVLARVVGPYLFSAVNSLYIEALYVAEGARRRGVGHALMQGAADLAASVDAAEVYSVPIPGSRGVQRFLARLGFAPVAGHRVVATSLLQRRLGADLNASQRRGRSLEDLIARRRRARSDGQSGPVDLRELRLAREASPRTGRIPRVRVETLPGESRR